MKYFFFLNWIEVKIERKIRRIIDEMASKNEPQMWIEFVRRANFIRSIIASL